MNESYELEHFTPQPDVSLLNTIKYDWPNCIKKMYINSKNYFKIYLLFFFFILTF